jgi:uncharacterized protein YcbK (DUF882 family)
MAKAKSSECWCFYGWVCEDHPDKPGVTREEIEKRMEELAREYVQTRDKKIDKRIIDELYELDRELEKMEKKSLD